MVLQHGSSSLDENFCIMEGEKMIDLGGSKPILVYFCCLISRSLLSEGGVRCAVLTSRSCFVLLLPPVLLEHQGIFLHEENLKSYPGSYLGNAAEPVVVCT